jgi:hypothetical protein
VHGSTFPPPLTPRPQPWRCGLPRCVREDGYDIQLVGVRDEGSCGVQPTGAREDGSCGSREKLTSHVLASEL